MKFANEADETPDAEPGDVLVVIQQVEHDVFRREGDNLVMKKTITLNEALTSFAFIVEHLDGRKLLVQSTPGHVYRPGDFKKSLMKSMPTKDNAYVKGDLFIQFDVKFPEHNELSADARKTLAKVLPGPL